MEEDMWHFQCFMTYYFKKGKNATEMQKKKMCAMYEEGAMTDWSVKSGLQSFLVLLTFWSNNYFLWGCIRHWKIFSSTPGHYPPEASQHTENIQINKVIGENEKYVFYFTGKN